MTERKVGGWSAPTVTGGAARAAQDKRQALDVSNRASMASMVKGGTLAAALRGAGPVSIERSSSGAMTAKVGDFVIGTAGKGGQILSYRGTDLNPPVGLGTKEVAALDAALVKQADALPKKSWGDRAAAAASEAGQTAAVGVMAPTGVMVGVAAKAISPNKDVYQTAQNLIDKGRHAVPVRQLSPKVLVGEANRDSIDAFRSKLGTKGWG